MLIKKKKSWLIKFYITSYNRKNRPLREYRLCTQQTGQRKLKLSLVVRTSSEYIVNLEDRNYRVVITLNIKVILGS